MPHKRAPGPPPPKADPLLQPEVMEAAFLGLPAPAPESGVQADEEPPTPDLGGDHPTSDNELLVDGDYIIGKDGLKRRRKTGHLLPGQKPMGPGRRPGFRLRQAREMLQISLHNGGGTAWFDELRERHPIVYAKLVAKLMPTVMEGSVSGSIQIVAPLPRTALDDEVSGAAPRDDVTIIDAETGEPVTKG